VFCERLARRGYDLLVVSRDGNRLEALKRELEESSTIQVEVFPADLTIDNDVSMVMARMAQSPRLTLLVNNAGFGTRGPLVSASPARQEAMLRLHTMAPMRLSQAALPILLNNRRGGIVNVSSIASFIFAAENVNYCATKAYLTTFSESLAAEVVGTGVQVQALCPGFTRTEFHDRIPVPDRLPRFAWMTAPSVVGHSLRCLDRGGPTVCIPGLGFRIVVGIVRFSPRRLIGWVSRKRYDRV
jgi:uncharacterized protein